MKLQVDMDPMGKDQLDYEEEEYGGSQKMQYHGGGAISALAEDEIIGEDDEYDDLYNDVNVGEGFHQLQRSEVPGPSAGAINEGFQTQKPTVPEPRAENLAPKEINIHGASTDGKYTNIGVPFPDPKERPTAEMGANIGANNGAQKLIAAAGTTNDAQVFNQGFRGSVSAVQSRGLDPVDMSGKLANESVPLLNPNVGVPRGVPQMPSNHSNVNVNMNQQPANEYPIRPAVDNGPTMLYVGELHWWTTDAEIESVSSQYGRVKEIKFFDEKASGKSKGYCQVEFYDSAAAAACKEGMNGHVFNGRPCVVAFASPQAMRQMGASYMNKSQVQPQSQQQGRRPMNDGAGRGGGTNYPSGDTGRPFGRGGWPRGGQGVGNRGGGHMRGTGGGMGPKNMGGNGPGIGNGANAGGYNQGLAGPGFGGPPGGFMHPQGMMGGGFDPTYMGRGSGYGGFPGPGFSGMIPPFPNMGLAGVAPHVNPAFFGRGMGSNGMGMMGNAGMDGPHSGMWNDTNMSGWGGEEHGQRIRESSYGGEDGGSEYGYGDASHDKGGARSNPVSREKERGSERDWSGNSDKRHRDERDQDRKSYDREHRYREEKDDYREHRQKDRDSAYKEDWDRGHTSSRSRSRSRMPEEDHRSRSRDGDYGKRRRLPSD